MPRRQKPVTQEQLDLQLQQIHLLDPSSSSENLEQLGPIIKQTHANRQQDAFLRTLLGLIEAKDAEIEKICSENYQDFISSVSTLFTVKSYTDTMRENISSLDTSVSQLGRGLVEKKKALLQTKKTATNLDEAIDTLQACLRVLDVVDRVGQMIREGKYWSALRVRVSRLLADMINRVTVSGRYPESPINNTVSNTTASAYIVFTAITASSNQGRGDRFHETVATGNPQ